MYSDGSYRTEPNTSQPLQDRHPRRFRSILKVVVAIVILCELLNPRATETALTLTIFLGLCLFFLAARAFWRTLRRPIGTLTVLDVSLGSMIVRFHSRSGLPKST